MYSCGRAGFCKKGDKNKIQNYNFTPTSNACVFVSRQPLADSLYVSKRIDVYCHQYQSLTIGHPIFRPISGRLVSSWWRRGRGARVAVRKTSEQGPPVDGDRALDEGSRYIMSTTTRCAFDRALCNDSTMTSRIKAKKGSIP